MSNMSQSDTIAKLISDYEDSVFSTALRRETIYVLGMSIIREYDPKLPHNVNFKQLEAGKDYEYLDVPINLKYLFDQFVNVIQISSYGFMNPKTPTELFDLSNNYLKYWIYTKNDNVYDVPAGKYVIRIHSEFAKTKEQLYSMAGLPYPS